MKTNPPIWADEYRGIVYIYYSPYRPVSIVNLPKDTVVVLTAGNPRYVWVTEPLPADYCKQTDLEWVETKVLDEDHVGDRSIYHNRWQ